MPIDTLDVLHCYLPEGLKAEVVKEIKPLFFFPASTCARRIFVFSGLDESQLTILHKIKLSYPSMEIFHGCEAYQFLLTWMVGLLSDKMNHNDQFVLGKVREHWSEFSKKNGKSAANSLFKIIPMLFEDARRIRGKIETELLGTETDFRIKYTHELCQTYSDRRKVGVICASYDAIISKLSKDQIEQEILHHKQILKNRNGLAPNTYSKMLAHIKFSIVTAWEKKQLEHKLDTVSIERVTMGLTS